MMRRSDISKLFTSTVSGSLAAAINAYTNTYALTQRKTVYSWVNNLNVFMNHSSGS